MMQLLISDVSGAHKDANFRANLIETVLRAKYGPPSEHAILY